MSRELNRQDFSINKATAERETELSVLAVDVSERLSGDHRLIIGKIDALTGNPAVVYSESTLAEKGNYVQRALKHLRDISEVLGLEPRQIAEFEADPYDQTTSSGSIAVHLQQQYKGIPIFQSAETVYFAPNGALQATVGRAVSVSEELELSSAFSVEQAVLAAARHIAVPHADELGETDQFGEPLNLTRVDLTDFTPKVIARFLHPVSQPTVLEAGPFGEPIKASLIWFSLASDIRLTWEVILTMPNYEGQYRILVEAKTGEILYCRQLMNFIAAQANVYRLDGSAPRQITNLPRALAEYGLALPTGLPTDFPGSWVDTEQTIGNNVNARLGNNGVAVRGNIENGILTFKPTDPVGDEQKVVNLFYYNCYMHDFFYLLGFREADGNFQTNNFGRGGIPSDAVDARSHSGFVTGTANMFTPVDGISPIMNMGLKTSTNRHTAFDASVVFHEFTHGVTNRLVGGPMNDHALDAPQSGGMGEGWGDYIACTITNSTVVGSWVTNQARGFRAFPYDSNYPDHFGALGTGRYTGVHNIGEIWCATLLEMNRKIGSQLGLQLVVDALKISPANPSFLDMRDAILVALTHKRDAGQLSSGEYETIQKDIWVVFAKFGMGVDAKSNGATLSGIVADFKQPSESPGPTPPTSSSLRVEATPNVPIPDNQPVGVTSTLTISQSGKIARLAVSVDIEHTYIGDLQVILTSPGGATAILHNRGGGGTDNLVKSYKSENTPSLASFIGQQAQGNWTLKVVDLSRLDLGTLRKWSLELKF